MKEDKLIRYASALWHAIISFVERDAHSSSAHIAMALILAVFPFTISVVAIAGILSAEIPPSEIASFVFATWPEVVAEPILSELTAVAQQNNTGKLTFGLLFAVVFASSGVDAIRLAVAEVYRHEKPQHALMSYILNLVFVLGGAVVLIGVLTLQIGLPFYLDFVAGSSVPGAARFFQSDWLRDLVTLTVLAFAVCACHLWLPGQRQPFKTILPGVVFTLVMWWVTGGIFSFYLSNIADYSLTYAGLAGVMGAMIFLNLMAAIFILGVELNAKLGEFSSL